MKVLVSACLLGENCKYNGGNNYSSAVAEFVRGKEILSICPELMAGMGCPRTPIEIVDGVMMDRDGKNVDTAMREAVEMAMKQLSSEEIQCAVLQSRSPTCGVNQVYDGSFSGKLIPGAGIFAQALKEAGYRVIDAEDVGKEQKLCFLVVRSSGKQCLGATQPDFRLLGESPKPQICSFGQATRFVNADILMEGWRVSLQPLPTHQSKNKKFAHTGLVKSRVGDCHACLKTAKAPARMPLASARATWWA